MATVSQIFSILEPVRPTGLKTQDTAGRESQHSQDPLLLLVSGVLTKAIGGKVSVPEVPEDEVVLGAAGGHLVALGGQSLAHGLRVGLDLLGVLLELGRHHLLQLRRHTYTQRRQKKHTKRVSQLTKSFSNSAGATENGGRRTLLIFNERIWARTGDLVLVGATLKGGEHGLVDAGLEAAVVLAEEDEACSTVKRSPEAIS